ncbi:Proteasome maturation factor UMP1 [Zea mays]|uniref:Proteasome maturation factor UMP1 n=1 Tax=Zea mays TaxID=4577 RepID=A0A1D6HNK0_MAIZE|nr:Proteasome maturation factor UMP1 [Zea mays]
MASGSMKREISETHDTLRFGLNAGVKADLAPPHPLQSSIQSEAKFWADKKKFGTEAIYGSALNIRKDLDAQILSRIAIFTDKILYTVSAFGVSLLPCVPVLELETSSWFQRPPGALPSSLLGYEALTGSLDDFGFEDYLNMPQDSEGFRQPDMHHGMEVRLGLSKGPICPSFS